MINRLADWLDHRTGYRDLMREALDEPIPGGARWRYVWGSTLVFTFGMQVLTGFMLWFAYSPSTRTAWESVFFIQNEMHFGWLIRGLHHFTAQAMVVLLVFHLIQVVIDGAYKAPREVNFWLGLVLMQIVLGLGLTGYLLPWDQKGYYATQVSTEIMGSTPVIGPQLQQLVQGGPEYGHHTLTRFFALHAGVLPALLVAFLFLHIYVFRRHAITTKLPHRAPTTTFWPDQVLRDGVACLIVLAAVGFLAVWRGAELSAPANPGEPYEAARPEWYYLFLFRFLKFEWVSHMGEVTGLGEAFGAVVIPGALMGLLALMPLIAHIKGGHKFNVAYLVLVIFGAAGLTGLAIQEDWYSSSKDGLAFRAAVQQAHVDGERATELALSPSGIPPAGAITLLQSDPLTQGPKVFRTYCADCHQPASMAGQFTAAAQAPELADLTEREKIRFADRTWITAVLTDFRGHFGALANIKAETGSPAEQEARAKAAEAILNGGSMADWSQTNAEILKTSDGGANLKGIVEFLYAQSGKADAVLPDDPAYARGREIFENGLTLMQGDQQVTVDACSGCHTLHVRGEADEAFSGGSPILTGYGGQDWLRAFISDPAAHYGSNNAMPGFATQLTPQEMDMLVRWLTGDYYRAAMAVETSAPAAE
ncbi:MAG: cytochrome b N-terminal domain-containing protein [Planctomycetaceae bacterium]|nr:cytochrome b N-terminal domain-containing protein [Planctomycetaceae bacterium]